MPANPRIDKSLFAAGVQCAKRLYLEAHHPDRLPEPPQSRQQLAEIGLRLTDLATQGFPRSDKVEESDHAAAVEKTHALLEADSGGAILDAAFERDGVEVRCDIVLANRDGSLDIFEVKSGTKVKPRHVMDVALQMWTIEGSGRSVRAASILHLDAEYRHDGSKDYPVHSFFKNVDVTKKAKRRKRRIPEYVETFLNALKDDTSLDLPTGTWCTQPIPCAFLPQCLEEGPKHPLVELPDLTPGQESGLHQQGIETIDQVNAEVTELTSTQQRALRALAEDGLVVDDRLTQEFDTIIFPLCFIATDLSLQVLPVFEKTRPWQHLPILWSARILHEDGKVEEKSFISDSSRDPRADFVVTLADCIDEVGTVFTFSRRLEPALRQTMEDVPKTKDDVRALLQMEPIEFDLLLRDSVYHPVMKARFELEDWHAAVLEGTRPTPRTSGIKHEEDARAAFDKLLNARTRATTRQKLRKELLAWSGERAQMMLEIFQKLR